jgi:hypothetical protein
VFALVMATGGFVSAQGKAVTSARMRLVTTPTTEWWVTIHNASDLGLVEARVTAGSSMVTWNGHNDFETRPIARNESHRLLLGGTYATAPPARLVLAAYEDGSYEGTQAGIDAFLKDQRALKEDLEFWIAAIGSMPLGTDAEVRAYLIQQTSLRAGGSSIGGILRSLATETVRRPSGWYAGVARNYRDSAARELAFVVASLAPSARRPLARQGTTTVVTSAGGAEMSVEIENLRDVALEAWGVEVRYDPSSRRGSSSVSSDSCIAPPDAPSERVQGHQTRRFRIGRLDDPSASPLVSLSHAVWIDSMAEGRDADRAGVFAQREREAAVNAFWIGELKRVSSLPVVDALAELQAVRAARRNAVQSEHDPLGSNIELWAAEAARSPATVSARLVAYADTLAAQRERLLRHLVKGTSKRAEGKGQRSEVED